MSIFKNNNFHSTKIYLKREENKEHIFDGFEKLAENKIYKLITHKAMIYMFFIFFTF